MTNPKVSVIIPVYNAEKYICACLDSIKAQTLKEIEIICVDDGSTDGSKNILHDYAEKDKRFIIIEQAHLFSGTARNSGLAIAKGNYLSFLDSDDFFEPNMLEIAYLKCIEENLDIVVFDYDNYDNLTSTFFPGTSLKDNLLPEKRPFTGLENSKNIFRSFNGWAWDKLFRTDFIRTNKIFFQEQRSSNDTFFVYFSLAKAERISVLPKKILAHHRRNVLDSVSMTREISWQGFHSALIAVRDALKKENIYEIFEQGFINYALNFSLWNLNSFQKGPSYLNLYKKLRDEWFMDFGVEGRSREYFFSDKEFKQYLYIMKTPEDQYIGEILESMQSEINNLNDVLSSIKNSLSYRIGRKITSVPRKLRDFFCGTSHNK